MGYIYLKEVILQMMNGLDGKGASHYGRGISLNPAFCKKLFYKLIIDLLRCGILNNLMNIIQINNYIK